MSRKKLYWTPEKVEWLRENCNEPKSEILKKFKGKTWKAIKHVMGNNGIHRDRDKAPNKTKVARKWTPEKIEELRKHRKDDWLELQKMFSASRSTLEKVMCFHKISRDRLESTLWNDEVDKILINAVLESNKYNSKAGEGRRQLRKIREELVKNLKVAGFKGHTSRNAFSARISNLTDKRIKTLGFKDISAPLGWGAPLEVFGRSPEQKDLPPTGKDWFEVLAEKNPVRYKELQENFLERFRSDYRLPGNSNLDLMKEWACPTEEGLRHAARFLGENRNRLQIVTAIKTPDQVEKLIEKRLAEIVKSGVLVNTDIQNIFEQIRTEFPLVATSLTQDAFKTQLLKVAKEKTSENLENCLRLDMLPDFYAYNTHIPKKMIDGWVEELRGKSRLVQAVSFRRGLGRILDETSHKKDEKFKLPESTFKRPFKIVTEKKSWKTSFPNAPFIGTLYNPIMKENPLWRAFVDAESNGDVAMFLANIIDLDIRKASGSATKIYRSLFSGLNVNLEIIDPGYRTRAAEIIDKSPDDMVLYETVAESFHDVVSGLSKILNHEDKLQYSGKIYVILTKKEQDIVAKAAYMEERYITLTRIAKLNLEKGMLAEKIGRGGAKKEELDQLNREIARTIISLVHSQEDRRFYKRVLAFMVRQIEKALGPNCQVIGMGTSHIEINGLLGECHIPDNETVTDEYLKKYNQTFGGKSFLNQMPDFTVVMPSGTLGAKETERERYVEGQRLMPTKIFVAPPLVDDKFLRRALNNEAHRVHPLAKAVGSYQFMPGMLRLEYSNGDINPHHLSMESLALQNRKKQLKDSRETYSGKFFVIKTGTDPHHGGRSKVYAYDQENKRHLGMVEAVIEMERQGGLFQSGKMRIHCYNMNDDGVQARNFETQYQPSPQQMSYVEIEGDLAEFEKKIEKSNNPEEIKRWVMEKNDLIRDQFQVRGSDYPKEQIHQVFERHIEPNVDFFDALLSRVVDSGVQYKGLSEITGDRKDTRDVGAVNYGTGNHLDHTVWGAVTEGDLYATKVQDKLLALERWKNNPQIVRKLVRAPVHSNEFFACGRIVMPGGYEYAVDFRGTTPRFASWADPLLGFVRNDLFAGDMEGHKSGYFTITTVGDKHFFASTYTPRIFYHMGASGSHTDQYGKRGFSPNNTGVSFLLVPVEGPENGPIIVRTLSATYIKNYFKKPFKIDWEELLPSTL